MEDVENQNVALARKATAHLATPVSERSLADYRTFFESLTEDVVFEYSSPDGAGEIKGKDAFVDYVNDSLSRLAGPDDKEDVELESPLEFIDDGDRVIVMWQESVKIRSSGAIHASKEVVIVLYFLDGLIARLRKFSQ